MAVNTGPYVGAKSCTNGPQPGAWGAMDWFVSAYRSRGGVNSGIYNCRSVRGARTTSIHGEGRALDFGVRPHGAAWGTALARLLWSMSRELGIQCIIWNRQIISSSRHREGWRRYTGANAHVDHLHVELTWAAAWRGRKEAQQLWARTLKSGSGGGGGSSSRPVWETSARIRGLSTAQVKSIQNRLIKAGFSVGKHAADGSYKGDTVTAVKAAQKALGVTQDGVWGPDTDRRFAAKYETKGGSKPAPSKPAPKLPTPKAPAFPLPRGKGGDFFYGPASGPVTSVSGRSGNSRVRGDVVRSGGRWYSKGLKRYQEQLRKRGYRITADGRYGPQTESATDNLQRLAHLTRDKKVGPATWKAAWELPVA